MMSFSMKSAASVYPRPRGGTPLRLVPKPRRRGLSPPTRGNPRPAPKMLNGGGLSPPTRGNRNSNRRLLGYARSIPAHAGEP